MMNSTNCTTPQSPRFISEASRCPPSTPRPPLKRKAKITIDSDNNILIPEIDSRGPARIISLADCPAVPFNFPKPAPVVWQDRERGYIGSRRLKK